jgi:deoxyribose-phosphate aldolase
MNSLPTYIDHTQLNASAPFGDYTIAVRDCIQYKFASLVVNPFFVQLTSKLLRNEPFCKTNVCSVISFPLGLEDILSKREEAIHALAHGAEELDLVVNISAVKSQDFKRVADEIRSVREESQGHILKVILEVGLLTDLEIKKVSEICITERCDFLKTSTGVNIKLPFEETLRYSKMLVDISNGTRISVKASGGISTLDQCKQLIDIGVKRIGTSKSIQIMNELKGEI